MNLYEALGRKEAELLTIRAERDTAVNLVRQLKSGEISLDDIHIGPASPEPDSEPVTASSNGSKPTEG